MPRPTPRPTDPTSTTPRGDTASAVLDVAQQLAQVRGFHGFSYRDVAEAIGTTTTAVHYHFRTKDDLGVALVEKYARDFATLLAAIDAEGGDGFARLDAFRRLYQQVLDGARLCLCNMLAAESATLAPPIRAALHAYFDANVAWVTGVFERGLADGSLTTSTSSTAREAAEAMAAGLEGAMLLAWSRRDPSWFARVSAGVLAAHRPHRD